MVYNSSIVEFMMSNKKMKLFLIEMATTWISQKYSLELNSDFKLPNMKYKGGDVTSQHIRATPTGPLVSEVPCDLDLDPSFPLLVKPQGFKAQVSRTNGSSTSILLNLSAGSATERSPIQTSHNSLEKPSEASCEQLTSRSESTALNSNQSSCTVPSAEALPSKDKCLPFCSNPSDAISLDRAACNGETRLGDRQQFPVFDMPTGQPRIELDYSSRPVDAVFVMIIFPQLNLLDLDVFVTYTQLLIKAKFHEPFEVFLPFCTELLAVDASYDLSKGLLTLKLPFLPYGQALA